MAAQGTTLKRIHKAASTGEFTWDIFEGDDFCVERVTLNFSAAPVALENITGTVKDETDSDYDELLISYDPNGQTSASFLCAASIANGDKFRVYYKNTNGRTITAKATVRL